MSLSSWNKNNIFKFSIDNEHVDETLTDFPVLLNFSSTSGKNNFDCTNIFDELVLGTMDDDFTGTDGDAPNSLLWAIEKSVIIGDTHVHEIFENKLFLKVSSNGVDSSHYTQVTSLFKLKGDFDVQVDISGYTYVGSTTYTWAYFSVGSNVSFKKTNVFGATIIGNSEVESATRSNDWGKLRIVRVGSIETTYVKDGDSGSWEQITTGTGDTSDRSVQLRMYTWYGSNDSIEAYWDNFTVNSGTVVDSTGNNPNNKKIAVVYPSVQEHWVQEYIDNYTVLLIHSDDNDSSTTFIDSSDSKHVISANGHVYHEIDQKKFGNSSIHFDGADDYLSIPNSTDFVLGTGDFTIDFQIRFKTFNAAADYIFFCRYNSDSNQGWQVYRSATNGFGFLADTGSTYTVSDGIPGNMVVDTWYHLAVTRADGVLRLFIDGISVKEESFIHNIPLSNDDLVIGVHPATGIYDLDGYLDEIRVSKGIARWTENFTPPTAPYSKENVLKQYIHGEQEQLFCEVERWDQTNENAQLWVKVPRILSDQPTDLLLYYDNTQEDNDYYVGDTSSWPAQQVWDDSFVGVYHMSQDPSGGTNCILDSTVNSYNGTPYGSMTSGDLIDGQVGKALDFDGIDDYIDLGTGLVNTVRYKNFTSEIVVSSTTTDNSRLLGYFAGEDEIRHNTNTATYDDGVAVDASFGNVIIDTWYHSAYVISSSFLKAYLDGSETDFMDVSARTTLSVSSYPVVLGARDDGTPDGFSPSKKISEVRISTGQRSADWIKTTNLSLTDALINISQAAIFQFTGYVKEFGEPAERMVYLYDRASGELVDKNISNSLGYYTLNTTTSGTHNIICLDASSAPDFDDLIISKVTPTESI